MNIRKKLKNLFKEYGATIIFLVALVLISLFFNLFPKNNYQATNRVENLKCVTSVEDKIVRGDSLKGVVDSGQIVRAIFNYYQCNTPQREDIVLVHYAGDANPIIKIIKGVSGDTFSLQQNFSSWNIIINGKVLRNSEGREYLIDEAKYKMLSLYVNSYNGKIPDDAFLILGNTTEGSIDSTKFGLVGRNDLIAKVEIK